MKRCCCRRGEHRSSAKHSQTQQADGQWPPLRVQLCRFRQNRGTSTSSAQCAHWAPSPPGEGLKSVLLLRDVVFRCLLLLLLRQLLVHLHQLRDAGGFGVELAPEAIGLHNGFVVGLVRFAQLRRHGDFVVEIGKAAIGV